MTTTAAWADDRLATTTGRDEIRKQLADGHYPTELADRVTAEIDRIETAIEWMEAS